MSASSVPRLGSCDISHPLLLPNQCTNVFEVIISFYMAIYFPPVIPRALGTFHELLLSLFPIFRSGRAGQILFLELSRDGSADLGKNLHMVVWYISPVGRYLSVIASFHPTSKGFLKLVSSFLMK